MRRATRNRDRSQAYFCADGCAYRNGRATDRHAECDSHFDRHPTERHANSSADGYGCAAYCYSETYFD